MRWGECRTITAELDREDFIIRHTSVLAPPLVPELKLHLAHEAVPLWQKTEEELGEMGLPPPFWAFAWAGGQALARYVLDHPHTVQGCTVLDVATGSGLVAIAAMQAGAAQVKAVEIDAFAATAARLNAALNGMTITVALEDVLHQPPPPVQVILVGDLFYEKTLAERCFLWLQQAQSQGTNVYIGDPGRSYLPKDKLRQLTHYQVPVSRDLEDAEIKKTAVWTIV